MEDPSADPVRPVYPDRLQRVIYGFAMYAEHEAFTLAQGAQGGGQEG